LKADISKYWYIESNGMMAPAFAQSVDGLEISKTTCSHAPFQTTYLFAKPHFWLLQSKPLYVRPNK